MPIQACEHRRTCGVLLQAEHALQVPPASSLSSGIYDSTAARSHDCSPCTQMMRPGDTPIKYLQLKTNGALSQAQQPTCCCASRLPYLNLACSETLVINQHTKHVCSYSGHCDLQHQSNKRGFGKAIHVVQAALACRTYRCEDAEFLAWHPMSLRSLGMPG
jgi:hypothetical protein